MSALHHKILRGTSYNALGLLASMILNFVAIGVIAQMLGLEKLGLIAISALFSVIGIVSIFDFGIPGALTRELAVLFKANERVDASKLFWSCFLFFVLIGLFISLVLISLMSYIIDNLFSIGPEYSARFGYAMCFMFFSHVYQFPALIIKASYRAQERYGTLQSVLVSVEALRVISLITFVYLGFDFDTIIIINSTLPFLIPLILWLYLPRDLRWVPKVTELLSFDFAKIRRLASFIFVQRISAMAFNNMDRVVAGVWLGPLLVGVVEVFSKIPLLINRFLGLSISTLVPAVSGMTIGKDQHRLLEIYHLGFKLYYSVIAPPAILLLAFAPQVLDLWVGVSDQTAIICMRVMLVWCLIVPLQFGGHMLIGINQRVGSYTQFIVLLSVLKLTATLVMFPVIGIYSLPLGYLIASSSTLYLLLILRSTIGISLKRQSWDVFLVILSSVAPVLIFHQFMPAIVSLGTLALCLVGYYLLQLFMLFGIAATTKERTYIIGSILQFRSLLRS